MRQTRFLSKTAKRVDTLQLAKRTTVGAKGRPAENSERSTSINL
jgi:hypothetical protein